MKLDIEEIKERVEKCETDLAPYRRMAVEMEDLWMMKVFDRTAKQALEQDGQEQVTLPTTFNVVHLAQRLISSDARIEVPAEGAELDDDQSASRRRRFLSAFYQRTNREQGRDIIGDATWQALVRGRFVFQVLWVRDDLPKRLQNSRLPILLRTLDPLNVGMRMGPLFTEFAYHKDKQTPVALRQMFPDYKPKRQKNRFARGKDEDQVEVVDFWWTDPNTGDVWNAVTCEEQFVKKPVKTDYPAIPIIMGLGDSAPIQSEEFRSLSILYPLRELYPYQCRLASQIGTGLLWYFWPAITIENEQGADVPDFKVQPGTTNVLPAGTKVGMIKAEVNTPLANNMLGIVDGNIQQSTFPNVMYGEAGGMQAGYGVNILADQARGRVNQYRRNLEGGLEQVNELVLGLVDKMAGDEGVKIWGKDEKSGSIYQEQLYPEDIQGSYQSMVTLIPAITPDDMQKETLGLRKVEMGIISKRSYREKISRLEFPDDEQLRVEMEKAMESDELRPNAMLRAIQRYNPDTWQQIIAGSPVEELANKQMEKARAEAEAEQAGVPPGMPPGMPPGGPPMPPGMPPGMGPGPGGPPMPPGMPPGMGPAMAGPGSIQPPGLVPGMPPQMQGQLTPEMLGLPPGAAPGVFQAATGQPPLSPEDEMRRALGMPPGMMP